jgi:hypothetical protein
MKFFLSILTLVATLTLAADVRSDTTVDDGDIARAISKWTGHPIDSDLMAWSRAIHGECDTNLECYDLASVSSDESNFVSWVLDYSCNDAEWRRLNQKDKVCDRGAAFGPFQIQDPGLKGASPEIHAMRALSILRSAPQMWTVWPHAHARAKAWLARHP